MLQVGITKELAEQRALRAQRDSPFQRGVQKRKQYWGRVDDG